MHARAGLAGPARPGPETRGPAVRRLDCLHLSFTAGPAAAALAERALGAELAALAGWSHPCSDADPDSEPDSDESDLE